LNNFLFIFLGVVSYILIVFLSNRYVDSTIQFSKNKRRNKSFKTKQYEIMCKLP